MAWHRHARGSGVVAWQNAVMLFINLGDGGGPYHNKFSDGGQRISWSAMLPSPLGRGSGNAGEGITDKTCVGHNVMVTAFSNVFQPSNTCVLISQPPQLTSVEAFKSCRARLHFMYRPANVFTVAAQSCMHVLMGNTHGQCSLCTACLGTGFCLIMPDAEGLPASLTQRAICRSHREQFVWVSYAGQCVICAAALISWLIYYTRYPSSHHSAQHPVIEWMLGPGPEAPRGFGPPIVLIDSPAVQPAVLLFCRMCSTWPTRKGPFIFCGQLTPHHVDWTAARGSGEVIWTLKVQGLKCLWRCSIANLQLPIPAILSISGHNHCQCKLSATYTTHQLMAAGL